MQSHPRGWHRAGQGSKLGIGRHTKTDMKDRQKQPLGHMQIDSLRHSHSRQHWTPEQTPQLDYLDKGSKSASATGDFKHVGAGPLPAPALHEAVEGH